MVKNMTKFILFFCSFFFFHVFVSANYRKHLCMQMKMKVGRQMTAY